MVESASGFIAVHPRPRKPVATAARRGTAWVAAAIALVAAALAAPAHAMDARELARQLAPAAPRLAPEVLARATRAFACAGGRGATRAATLSVIDYSLPSAQPRLWVFDLARKALLYEELVAHGRGSGEDRATRFSNTEGSHMSSLGAFQTQEAYTGINGYSLRLRGLEPGINDQARERAIVIHGADYVSQNFARRQGRLGRSHGCPAVRSEIARPLIDAIADGSFLFVDYPDPSWLKQSALLREDCSPG